MDNKKNGIPKLRFPGFTGAWEQRKFSEILAKSDGLRRGPFGSALKKEFFISSSEYTVYEQNNAIYNTWKTRYFITPEKFQELHKFQLVPGDFILSGAGTIGRIAQVPANITKGVFNQALIRIRINPEWMDKKFFLIWMQSENMQRKLTQANPGSAMTNLVPMSEIKKWEIIIPSKAEQNKIGEFIQKLNSLIALHQRKLEHLQEQKKGLLQKMFPKNGETVPEVRFPGFTDAWEQRKLGEVVERFDNLRIPVTSSKREKGITPYYGANGIQDYVQGYTHDGEFVLVAEDGANDLQNYPVHYVNGKVWVNNHAHVLQGKNKMVDNLFLVNAIKQIKIETYLVGGSRAKLNADVMMKLPIKVPTFNEQQKIGEYFSKFDTLITLHQRKLDHLELMKKGLLQQMFV
ncbi:restriction endonuclease subunit S [Ligilactobacillus salivarius]|nr:restriction endonuclease subunit S [Ligilactobacillus salivarius]